MKNYLTESIISDELTISSILMCTVASLVLGVLVALIHMIKNKKFSKSFVVTLAMLPTIVQIIVMLVNGNLGTGIAVAGAFSLVRFRSVPGNANDIGSIFFAMAIGFVTGMGYLFYGVIFLLLLGITRIVLMHIKFGNSSTNIKILKIVIPEDMDYDGVFADLFNKYTSQVELDKVKTTNMGSLYELTYSIVLKQDTISKAFLDEIRARNGNLNITLSRVLSEIAEL
ncbi:MAG: DUF4956 domain-containing protein [Christensenellaceae bacterium]|jgi:hypothetical protein|nr:DUF4956 domain-containing protein [Christensenellaceae bacterium]